MAEIVDIHANLPHCVDEVICLKCLERWVAVYQPKTPLKKLECASGHIGFVIKTGQEIIND